jgi:uncharacterized Fe-S radical SAM superfamily protein PflX
MEREDDVPGIVVVEPTSFFSNDLEKTKLNWFCYELSISIYDKIQDNLGKELKNLEIDKKAIAEFSIHISKKIRDSILQKPPSRIEKVYVPSEVVKQYFPNLSHEIRRKMLNAISKAWDEQLSFCEICPTQCLIERDAYCTMFDQGPFPQM